MIESAKKFRPPFRPWGRFCPPLLLALWAVSRPAVGQVAFPEHDADTHRYRLSWRAPDTCPAQATVSAKIDRLLATSTLVSSTVVVVLAEVHASEASRFTARVAYELDGVSYNRDLEAVSCDAVASATALIIATLIDPEAVARAEAAFQDATPVEAAPAPATKEPVLGKPPKPERTQQAAPAWPASRSDAHDRKPPTSWSVAALSWGGVGVLPELAWGVGLSASMARASFSLAADVQYWGRQQRVIDQQTGAGATFERYGGTLRGCYRVLSRPLTAGACAGLELFVVHGVGSEITESRSGSPAWLAPVLGATTGFRLTRQLELTARLETSLPLVSHHFEIRGLGRVWSLPPIAGRAGLGAALVF